MARAAKKKTVKKKKKPSRILGTWKSMRRWVFRGLLGLIALVVIWVAALAFVTPPKTFYMRTEEGRVGPIKFTWVDFENISPVMARSAVAAEDANFCQHWGIDMGALREAIDEGGNRGASTISQQVTKNVFLWHGRSYPRKALEALLTPLVEAFWSKRRILEVYLNVAECDEGVFGVEAASRHYFGVSAAKLSAERAALLAAILPNPKERSALRPGAFTRKRAAAIEDGAATIAADGRADCFED